ncbi:hypothetical protein [Escherichia coli]|uniref:hypothetical protein n=1 Tax=Escherichia coli TaxID=562 RepID=UPI00201EEF25|nr:hypothetical protein [Escherichia coli]
MKKETIFSEVETANSKQLAVLKANFPQCFDKNGAFIQEKLLEIIRASEVELSKESYSLNWLGKSYALCWPIYHRKRCWQKIKHITNKKRTRTVKTC